MLNYIKLIVLGVVAVFALIAANYARDVAYMVHAIIIFLVAAGLFLWTLRRTDEPVPAKVLELSYMDGVVRAGVIATALWGVVGFLVALAFGFEDVSVQIAELDLDMILAQADPLHGVDVRRARQVPRPACSVWQCR